MSGTVGYRVRKYWTLASVFGAANSAGLQGGNALSADQVLLWNGAGYDTHYYQTAGIAPGTSSTGDQVLVWNGTTNAFDAYYYLTGTGWRKTTDTATDAGTTALATGTGFIIKRGAGGVVGTRGPNADMPGITLDSFHRTGTGDGNTSADRTPASPCRGSRPRP